MIHKETFSFNDLLLGFPYTDVYSNTRKYVTFVISLLRKYLPENEVCKNFIYDFSCVSFNKRNIDFLHKWVDAETLLMFYPSIDDTLNDNEVGGR